MPNFAGIGSGAYGMGMASGGPGGGLVGGGLGAYGGLTGFIERKDGFIFNSYQIGGNPPLNDQLRRREIAAEAHGGSPDDWKGRSVEVDLKPNCYIKSITPYGKGGYVVNQEISPEPSPPRPTIEERLASLEAKVAVLAVK